MDQQLYWTEFSAIATAITAATTFIAPLAALQISAWLSDRKEKRQRKLEVFQTLMQWRSIPYVERPVHALNLIDVLFHDVKPVREAWADLFSSYCDSRLNTAPEGTSIREDKLYALLKAMAKDLGYEKTFSIADFRRVYNPTALGRHYALLLAQQEQQIQTLANENAKAPSAQGAPTATETPANLAPAEVKK